MLTDSMTGHRQCRDSVDCIDSTLYSVEYSVLQCRDSVDCIDCTLYSVEYSVVQCRDSVDCRLYIVQCRVQCKDTVNTGPVVQ